MVARNPPSDIAGYDPVATAGDCTYDQEAAQKVVDFFRKFLVFTKGPTAGEPFILQPWQEDYVRTLFGWKKPDGRRRYRESYLEIGRKNGKTCLAAGISIYVLFCDGESEGQIYCAAGGREQATLVFTSAASMIRKSSILDSRCKIRDSTKRIMYDGSYMRAIPANESAVHGYEPHLIVGDELHVWRGRDFFDGLRSGMGSKSQPLEVYITTAGWDRESICYQQYEYACRVRDGQGDDPGFLPAIFEAEPGDDWTDPDVWKKANPNLGVSVYQDFLERECEKAKENASLENTFRRLYLNQWTSQDVRWLPMVRWRQSLFSSKSSIADGEQVWGGLDLSSTIDLTAWVLVARKGDGYKIQGHYFVPQDRMREAEKRDRVPYAKWASEGYVTVVPGARIDYNYVHERILSDAEKYELVSVGFDPWNAHATQSYLGEDRGIQMIEVRQGYASLSGASKLLEANVLSDQIDHGFDPVLDWMAGNAAVKTDENGNIKPVKPKHRHAKRVDGIVATVMAIFVEQTSERPAVSIYETEGALSG